MRTSNSLPFSWTRDQTIRYRMVRERTRGRTREQIAAIGGWLSGRGHPGLSVALGHPQPAGSRASTRSRQIDQVGGLWNMDNPGSAIYESAHFISSSARSGWADFPMPDDFPDYPRWFEIRDYIHAYAAHHRPGAALRVLRLGSTVPSPRAREPTTANAGT